MVLIELDVLINKTYFSKPGRHRVGTIGRVHVDIDNSNGEKRRQRNQDHIQTEQGT